MSDPTSLTDPTSSSEQILDLSEQSNQQLLESIFPPTQQLALPTSPSSSSYSSTNSTHTLVVNTTMSHQITAVDWASNDANKVIFQRAVGIPADSKPNILAKRVNQAIISMALHHEAIKDKSDFKKDTLFNEKWLECPTLMKQLRSAGMTEKHIQLLIKAQAFRGKTLCASDLTEFLPDQRKIYLKLVEPSNSVFEDFSSEEEDDEEENPEPNFLNSESESEIDSIPINRVRTRSSRKPKEKPVVITNACLSWETIQFPFANSNLSLNTWLNEIENKIFWKDLNNKDSIRALGVNLPQHMNASVRKWIEEDRKISFKDLCSRLRSTYIGKQEKSKALSEFYNSEFKKGTDVIKYIEKFKALARTINPKIDERSIALCIVFTLPPKLRFKLSHDSSYETIDQIGEQMSKWNDSPVKSNETFPSPTNSRRLFSKSNNASRPQGTSTTSTNSPPSTNNTNNDNQAQRRSNQQRNNNRNSNYQQRQRSSSKRNYNTNNNGTDTKCEKCGKSDHVTNDCNASNRDNSSASNVQSHFHMGNSAAHQGNPTDPLINISIEDNPNIKQLRAMVDSGAGTSLIKKDIADRLNLKVYYKPINFFGLHGNSKPKPCIGVTQIYVKVWPDYFKGSIRLYVFDDLLYDMILGHNFMFLTSTSILSAPQGQFVIQRHGEPMKVSMRIPGPSTWNYLFNQAFPRIFGKQISFSSEPPSSTPTSSSSQIHTHHQIAVDGQASNGVRAVSLDEPDPPPQFWAMMANHISEVDYDKQIIKRKIDQRREEFPEAILDFQQEIRKGISKDLTTAEQKAMKDFLTDNQNIFSRHKYDLGAVSPDIVDIKIDIGLNPVPQCRPYRLGPKKREILDAKIKELLDNDIIEPSNSRGGSPAFLVPKPNGSWRLVTSFQELNALCRTRQYPMPNVDDQIQALNGYNYFITIDLAQGFHQIVLRPSERDKVSFVTEVGLYRYKRLPMGLADSPAYFQEFVNRILGDMLYKSCLAYIDDVIIFGKTFNDLLINAKKVFDRLSQYGLKIQLAKSQFGHKEVKFLGHIISGTYIRPDPSKVERLKQFEPPRDIKALQSQLGLFNYLAKFIPNYATLASDLFALCSKRNGKFKWLPKHTAIWKQIKEALIKDCELCQFDPHKEHKLMVDASSIAVGGMLLQLEDGNWRPVSYFGKKLAKHQLAYTITEKECLAVIVGVRKYHAFLAGKKFVIISDHCALCALKKIDFKCTRLHRWATTLSEFDYVIQYARGEDHPADCLSRSNEWKHKKQGEINEEDFYKYIHFAHPSRPIFISNSSIEQENYNSSWSTQQIKLDEHCDDDDILAIETNELNDNKLKFVLLAKQISKEIAQQTGNPDLFNFTTIEKFILTAKKPVLSKGEKDIKQAQSEDNFCQQVKQQLKENKLTNKFIERQGIIYRRRKEQKIAIVLPESLKDRVFNAYHDEPLGGHYGFRPTLRRIKEQFWFPLMESFIREKCSTCETCLSYKHKTTNDERPRMMPIPDKPLQRIQIDVVGPFPASSKQNKVLFTCIDYLTKFCFAKAYRNQTHREFIHFLDYITQFVGFPEVIQTDNGGCFVHKFTKEYMKEKGIKHIFSTAFRPQSQGAVERLNGILGTRINMYTLNKRDWDKEIPSIILSYNSTPKESLKASPYQLLFNLNPRIPVENQLDLPSNNHPSNDINQTREEVKLSIIKNQEERLSKTPIKAPPFKVGEFVKKSIEAPDLKVGKKLTPKFKGRYIIIDVKDSCAKIIDTLTQETEIVNFKRLKRIPKSSREKVTESVSDSEQAIDQFKLNSSQ